MAFPDGSDSLGRQEVSACRAMFNKLMFVGWDESNNTRWVASMLSSQVCGQSMMPAQLGLTPEAFERMIHFYFPDVPITELQSAAYDASWLEMMPEKEELEALFHDVRKDDHEQRQWIAAMLIAGCAGHQHLWEDMGLFSRKDLTDLLNENFPAMAHKNVLNMKWKKFVYKQLCDRSNIHACPAPTCQACNDFKVCFAPEDQPSS